MNKLAQASLEKSLDTMAEQKAKDFISRIHRAIQNALKDTFRPAGNNYFAGPDIAKVLEHYVESIENHSYDPPDPSPELIHAFKASCLNKLITELPTLALLAKLHEQEEQNG